MKKLINYFTPIQPYLYTLLVIGISMSIFSCTRKQHFAKSETYYVLSIVQPNNNVSSIVAYRDSAHTVLISGTALDSLTCEKIYLKAIPSSGTIVASWSGIDAGSENADKTTAVVTMNENKTVSVSFGVNVHISLNKTSTNIEVGLTDTLKIISIPNNVSNLVITWTSLNPAIATIDNNGIITAKEDGTTKIIGTNSVGTTPDTCIVNVGLWDGNTLTPVISVDNTYFINAASQLAWIANQNNNGVSFENKKVILNNDINLNNKLWTPIGGDSHSLSFLGLFDGNNKIISNLYVDFSGSGGLFTYSSNIIENVILKNANVTAERNVGALVGHVLSGDVKNCIVESGRMLTTSLDDNVGGLVGEIDGGNIINCSTATTVNVQQNATTVGAGGLVGWNAGGNIVASSASGSVTNGYYTGGLIGLNNGNIIACKSTASVVVATGGRGGGLVGKSAIDITPTSIMIASSYATGNVSGNANIAGGLVGKNYSSSTITDCYATGNVSSISGTANLGSIIGNNAGNVNFSASTSGLATIGSNSGVSTNQILSNVTNVYSVITSSSNVATVNYNGNTVLVSSLWSNSFWNVTNQCPKLIWE